MYTIKWDNTPEGYLVLVGDINAILNIALILNSISNKGFKKRYFKIYSVDGVCLTAKQLNVSFEYMLDPSAIWPET